MVAMINYYYRKEKSEALSEVTDSRLGVWTNVVSPTDEELKAIVTEHNLEDTVVEDIQDFFEVPRFEIEDPNAYFFTRYPYDVKDLDIDTAPILFILTETSLITIAEQEVPFLKVFAEDKRSFATIDKTHLFIEFLTELMMAYERKLTRTRKMVYKDMGRVRSMRGKDVQRLVFIEQELNEMISALVPTNVWFNQLNKGNHLKFIDDDREMLEDLLIEAGQLIDSAKSILKTIQNIRVASETILTQGLNSTIRTLTAVTIVLTIPTLVSSLFGMNVPNPLEVYPHAFWIIVFLILVSVAFTVYFFNRNRWM
jgi:magnesium transporter